MAQHPAAVAKQRSLEGLHTAVRQEERRKPRRRKERSKPKSQQEKPREELKLAPHISIVVEKLGPTIDVHIAPQTRLVAARSCNPPQLRPAAPASIEVAEAERPRHTASIPPRVEVEARRATQAKLKRMSYQRPIPVEAVQLRAPTHPLALAAQSDIYVHTLKPKWSLALANHYTITVLWKPQPQSQTKPSGTAQAILRLGAPSRRHLDNSVVEAVLRAHTQHQCIVAPRPIPRRLTLDAAGEAEHPYAATLKRISIIHAEADPLFTALDAPREAPLSPKRPHDEARPLPSWPQQPNQLVASLVNRLTTQARSIGSPETTPGLGGSGNNGSSNPLLEEIMFNELMKLERKAEHLAETDTQIIIVKEALEDPAPLAMSAAEASQAKMLKLFGKKPSSASWRLDAS